MPAQKIEFKPADRTLYGRAMEIVVQGKRSAIELPLTAQEMANALRRAQAQGESEGWYRPRPGAHTNPWDVFYEFGSRRELPANVATYGYTGTRDHGGKWVLSKGVPPRIALPDPNDVETVVVRDLVPDTVRQMIPRNEQGSLARIGESGILAQFLGAQATFRIVAHWSTSGAEMDEVHCAIVDGVEVMVPVEAKSAGAREALRRTQFTRAISAIHTHFPGLSVRPVGLKVIDEVSVFLVEFNETEDPDELELVRIMRCVFAEPSA